MARDVLQGSSDTIDATPPVELGRTDLTDNPVTAITNAADFAVNTAATKWAVTVTTGSRPVVIEAFIPTMSHSVASAQAILKLFRDGSLAQVGTHWLGATIGQGIPGTIRLVDNPGAGSHTYELKLRGTAGNLTLACGVGFPAQLQVISV